MKFMDKSSPEAANVRSEVPRVVRVVVEASGHRYEAEMRAPKSAGFNHPVKDRQMVNLRKVF